MSSGLIFKRLFAVSFALLALFVWGCEDSSDSDSGPKTSMMLSDEKLEDTGELKFSIDSFIKDDYVIIEDGELADDKFADFWSGVAVRWGLRQQVATDEAAEGEENEGGEESSPETLGEISEIFWLQRSANYNDGIDASEYSTEYLITTPEEDKSFLVLNLQKLKETLPSELLDQLQAIPVDELELVAEVSDPLEVGRVISVASWPMPDEFEWVPGGLRITKPADRRSTLQMDDGDSPIMDFLAKADNPGLTYAWFLHMKKDDGSWSDWEEIGEEASLKYNFVTRPEGIYEVKVVATSSGQEAELASAGANIVEVRLNGQPLLFFTQPTGGRSGKAAGEATVGEDVEFVVDSHKDLSGSTYEWDYQAPGDADWTPGAAKGAGTEKFTLKTQGLEANAEQPYRVRVTVTDQQGGSAVAIYSLSLLANGAPTIEFIVSPKENLWLPVLNWDTGTEPQKFIARASDPDGDALSYSWTVNGETPEFTDIEMKNTGEVELVLYSPLKGKTEDQIEAVYSPFKGKETKAEEIVKMDDVWDDIAKVEVVATVSAGGQSDSVKRTFWVQALPPKPQQITYEEGTYLRRTRSYNFHVPALYFTAIFSELIGDNLPSGLRIEGELDLYSKNYIYNDKNYIYNERFGGHSFLFSTVIRNAFPLGRYKFRTSYAMIFCPKSEHDYESYHTEYHNGQEINYHKLGDTDFYSASHESHSYFSYFSGPMAELEFTIDDELELTVVE